MRKALLVILTTLLLLVWGLIMVNGLVVGKIEIPNLFSVIEKNRELKSKLQIANDQNARYQYLVNKIADGEVQKEKMKKAYLDYISICTDEQVKQTLGITSQTLDNLWSRIIAYSKKYNLTISVEIENSSIQVAGFQNLKFTITGATDDVYKALEVMKQDSELGFEIKDLEAEKTSTNGSTASFIVKDVLLTTENQISMPTNLTTAENIEGLNIKEVEIVEPVEENGDEKSENSDEIELEADGEIENDETENDKTETDETASDESNENANENENENEKGNENEKVEEEESTDE